MNGWVKAFPIGARCARFDYLGQLAAWWRWLPFCEVFPKLAVCPLLQHQTNPLPRCASRKTARVVGLLLLALSAFAAPLQAQFTYSIANNEATIIGFTGTNTTVVIPPTLDGYPVTSIEANVFLGRSFLTSVTIPDSVKLIGHHAFENCTSLTSITIPNSTTYIGQQAFWNCTGLTNVIIGVGVTNIDFNAFYGCSNLTGLTLGTNVAIIENWAFGDCRALTNVFIPDSVTYIGVGTFRYCDALVSIEVGAQNTAFSSVDGVLFTKDQHVLFKYPPAKSPSYAIPSHVTSIGVEAFRHCLELTNVVIPDSVADIQRYAFQDCTALASVTIPGAVTNLGAYAFRRCSSLLALQFWGHAPAVLASAFDETPTNLTVYIIEGKFGWPVPPNPWFGKATAYWQQIGRPPLIIQTGAAGVAVGTNGFGFTVSGPTNATLVVEAATNPSSPAWIPLETNALANGAMIFSDPHWTNQPMRFYRVRLQ